MATEHAHDGGCCSGAHDHGHDDYDGVDMSHDPTLSACCEKDRRAYNRAMELKRVLTDHDPTTQNVRQRQEIILPPPVNSTGATTRDTAIPAALSAVDKLGGDSEDSDDSDLDLGDDFDALWASRRLELAAQVQQTAKNAADGYGIVVATDFQSVLTQIKSTPEVPRVVFVRSSQIDSTVDHAMLEEMLAVATRFVGTKFYAIATKSDRASDDDALRQLRLSRAPSVVAFRLGQRVDATALQDKDLAASSSILWEARLVPWLTMCNVLETVRQDQSGKRTTSSSSSVQPARSSGKQQYDDTDDPAFDCGMATCRIRYAYEHEHVGPSQASKADVSAWRSS